MSLEVRETMLSSPTLRGCKTYLSASMVQAYGKMLGIGLRINDVKSTVALLSRGDKRVRHVIT